MGLSFPPTEQCDIAVVIPTVLRPSLLRAVDSVFSQDFAGTLHLLIGVDKATSGRDVLDRLAGKRPDNVFITILDPGFSTSQRHGGLWPAHDGGALRTVLSYLAHSRFIAYLDDDNWWAPNHLTSLREAIEGKGWAFSRRWFTLPDSDLALCEDIWESVGPGGGEYAAVFGGWSDPNTIMIDKVLCEPVLRGWCHPIPGESTAMSADRRVFHNLKETYAWAETGRATVYYQLNPNDPEHPNRWARIQNGLASQQFLSVDLAPIIHDSHWV